MTYLILVNICHYELCLAGQKSFLVGFSLETFRTAPPTISTNVLHFFLVYNINFYFLGATLYVIYVTTHTVDTYTYTHTQIELQRLRFTATDKSRRESK